MALEAEGESIWRVGFTRFATRMLGEAVELDFETKPGSEVETGQVIGWLEGFKAVSDIYTPLSGRFDGSNPGLDNDMEVIHADPYGRGWLFRIHGTPGDDCIDVHGYMSTLDATIDKMMGQRHEST